MRKTILTLAFTASTFAATACGAQSAPTMTSGRADTATAAANRAALSETLAAQPQTAATSPVGPDGMHRGPHRRGGGMRADTDRNGVVTRTEVIAQADARFARMDTDGDGILTAAERRGFRDSMRQAMRERREQRMAARGQDKRTDGKGHRPDRAQDKDARNEGVVTRAEFSDRAAQRFDRMDANRDGRLDASERPVGRAMRRGPGRGRHHAMSPDRAPASPNNAAGMSAAPDAATPQ